jgi:hypothetical protein
MKYSFILFFFLTNLAFSKPLNLNPIFNKISECHNLINPTEPKLEFMTMFPINDNKILFVGDYGAFIVDDYNTKERGESYSRKVFCLDSNVQIQISEASSFTIEYPCEVEKSTMKVNLNTVIKKIEDGLHLNDTFFNKQLNLVKLAKLYSKQPVYSYSSVKIDQWMHSFKNHCLPLKKTFSQIQEIENEVKNKVEAIKDYYLLFKNNFIDSLNRNYFGENMNFQQFQLFLDIYSSIVFETGITNSRKYCTVVRDGYKNNYKVSKVIVDYFKDDRKKTHTFTNKNTKDLNLVVTLFCSDVEEVF